MDKKNKNFKSFFSIFGKNKNSNSDVNDAKNDSLSELSDNNNKAENLDIENKVYENDYMLRFIQNYDKEKEKSFNSISINDNTQNENDIKNLNSFIEEESKQINELDYVKKQNIKYSQFPEDVSYDMNQMNNTDKENSSSVEIFEEKNEKNSDIIENIFGNKEQVNFTFDSDIEDFNTFLENYEQKPDKDDSITLNNNNNNNNNFEFSFYESEPSSISTKTDYKDEDNSYKKNVLEDESFKEEILNNDNSILFSEKICLESDNINSEENLKREDENIQEKNEELISILSSDEISECKSTNNFENDFISNDVVNEIPNASINTAIEDGKNKENQSILEKDCENLKKEDIDINNESYLKKQEYLENNVSCVNSESITYENFNNDNIDTYENIISKPLLSDIKSNEAYNKDEIKQILTDEEKLQRIREKKKRRKERKKEKIKKYIEEAKKLEENGLLSLNKNEEENENSAVDMPEKNFSKIETDSIINLPIKIDDEIVNYKFDKNKLSKIYDINYALKLYNFNEKKSIELLKDAAIYSKDNRDYMISYIAIKNLLYNKDKKYFLEIIKEIKVAKIKQILEMEKFINTLHLQIEELM